MRKSTKHRPPGFIDKWRAAKRATEIVMSDEEGRRHTMWEFPDGTIVDQNPNPPQRKSTPPPMLAEKRGRSRKPTRRPVHPGRYGHE